MELDIDPEFSAYWKNTISFAEHSQEKHDWHLRPEELQENAVLRLVPQSESGDLPT